MRQMYLEDIARKRENLKMDLWTFGVYECQECGTKHDDAQEAAECCEPKFRKAKMELFLSDARGIYIPRDFAECIVRERLSGVDHADLDYLARGPEDIEATGDEPAHDAEFYWEVWQKVCDNAIVTATDGTVYTLYQDGDLWLVEQGAELNDRDNDLGPDETGTDCMFVVRL